MGLLYFPKNKVRAVNICLLLLNAVVIKSLVVHVHYNPGQENYPTMNLEQIDKICACVRILESGLPSFI